MNLEFPREAIFLYPRANGNFQFEIYFLLNFHKKIYEVWYKTMMMPVVQVHISDTLEQQRKGDTWETYQVNMSVLSRALIETIVYFLSCLHECWDLSSHHHGPGFAGGKEPSPSHHLI